MSLNKLREEIDLIDAKIIELLKIRISLACKTEKFKKKIYDRKREKEILIKIKDPLIQEIYKTIFKAIKRKIRKSKSSFTQ